LTYPIDNLRSLGAVALILLLCWLLSENKRKFPFLLVFGAIGVQVLLILALFATPNSSAILSGIGYVIGGLTSATDKGSQFIFGYLGGGDQPFVLAEGQQPPFIFGFRVLTIILVISTLSAILWHWGVLKAIVRGFGFLFEKTMGLGGASALAVATNIFMGMVESPIVIRGYLDKLTRSELFMLMVVGLATVAGSTMVAYAFILGPVMDNAAGHVLTASIISAPAGVLLARVIVPEEKKGEALSHGSDLKYSSTMDAVTRGVADGTMVAVNVGAMLLVFVALVWIVNNMLALAPPVNGEALTLQGLFGYIFSPVAYMIGIPWSDAHAAGNVLGTKLFLTEFIAYIDLAALPDSEISDRSRMIMTYALCGFANVASVGITTGGLTVLIPSRREEILQLAWKALPPGYMATLVSASVISALPPGLFQ
jgi:CNT family concentrative nucleoside transporter